MQVRKITGSLMKRYLEAEEEIQALKAGKDSENANKIESRVKIVTDVARKEECDKDF